METVKKRKFSEFQSVLNLADRLTTPDFEVVKQRDFLRQHIWVMRANRHRHPIMRRFALRGLANLGEALNVSR